MRSNIIIAAFLIIFASGSALAQPAPTPRPFILKNVIRVYASGVNLDAEISTSGTAPLESELKTSTNWRFVYDTGTETKPVQHITVLWNSATKIATLEFPSSEVGQLDPKDLGWQAAYIGDVLLTATAPPPDPAAAFGVAKNKDDASLYLFGSWLAGKSTKPIYVIDTKIDLKHEWIRNNRTMGFWHFGGAASTNTNATPPVDKVRIDPDSITAFVNLTSTVPLHGSSKNSLKLELAPFTGEFTREDHLADWIASARTTYLPKPIGHMFALDPFAGVEAVHSLVKPDTVSDQKVDLSSWNAITRIVAGTSVEFYVFKVNATADDWYHVTFDASYTARVPLFPEPFVRQGVIDGQPAAVTTLEKNVRHYVESSVNWNVAKYVSVSVKYKYGSLPPLFQFIDHQFTVGLTLMAAQK